MNDRQLGIFIATEDMLRSDLCKTAAIFRLLKFVPVRVELKFDGRGNKFEYCGVSDQFEELEKSSEIPEYRIEITAGEDGKVTDVKAIKLDNQ